MRPASSSSPCLQGHCPFHEKFSEHEAKIEDPDHESGPCLKSMFSCPLCERVSHRLCDRIASESLISGYPDIVRGLHAVETLGAGNNEVLQFLEWSRGDAYRKCLGGMLQRCLRLVMTSYDSELWQIQPAQAILDELARNDATHRLCEWCHAVLLSLGHQI